MVQPAVVRNGREDRRYALMAAEINRLDSVVGSLIDGLQALHLQVCALAAVVKSMSEGIPGEHDPVHSRRTVN